MSILSANMYFLEHLFFMGAGILRHDTRTHCQVQNIVPHNMSHASDFWSRCFQERISLEILSSGPHHHYHCWFFSYFTIHRRNTGNAGCYLTFSQTLGPSSPVLSTLTGSNGFPEVQTSTFPSPTYRFLIYPGDVPSED